MTGKQIIINGFNLEYIKELLYNGQRIAITTNIFEAIIEELERKEQECEELRIDIKDIANLLDLDTVEEYSFSNIELEIKELKQQLDQLKGENVGALKQLEFVRTLNTVQEAEIRKLFKTLAEIKYITENHKATAHCDYLTDMDKILQKISEVER